MWRSTKRFRPRLPAPPRYHSACRRPELRTANQQEREQLVRALAAAAGNKAEAARAMGVARSTLVSRLKKLGLS